MISHNPFYEISNFIPPVLMQSFVVLMVILVIFGTLLDIIHKKNVKYFFENAKKAKKSAKKKLTNGKKTSVIIKTISSDILTTAELGFGKRRVTHLLGMYGTILFWISSVILIFCYSSSYITPSIWPIIWHVGAIMTCIGGFWFWIFLRVDVYSEANAWYRIIKADLFVLSLLAASSSLTGSETPVILEVSTFTTPVPSGAITIFPFAPSANVIVPVVAFPVLSTKL